MTRSKVGLISEDEVDEQMKRLRGPRGISLQQGKLLSYLIEARRKGRFLELDGRTILRRFEEKDKHKGKKITERAEIEKAVQRARRLAFDLNRSLLAYYRELPPGSPDTIKIVLSEHPDAMEDGQHRYEPQISRLTIQDVSEEAGIWFVGNNVKALEYVTQNMLKLNRIEETFVRWIPRTASLYGGRTFKVFLRALKESKLLYRAVLGPTTDSAIYEIGGLRESLAARSVDAPDDQAPTKLYRLSHDMALMNFTLLYYAENPNDFYQHTTSVEVLFGYGVHERFERADTTVVFRTFDSRLVEEFRELFKALRSEEFSRQLDLDRPDLFMNEPRLCDVLATFPCLPKDEVLRKTRASGTGELWSKSKDSAEYKEGDRDDKYVPGRPHIKICVSALLLLDDEVFVDELKKALKRSVQVSIAIWAPGPFIDARTKAAKLRPDAASRQIEGARSALRSLGRHNNLFVRECFGEWASTSIIWIDEFIYYSSYWNGMDVADGPHFLVTAESNTGGVLRDQYLQMLTASNLL